jgi:hypothetical protein
MTEQQHPITPPPELVQQWASSSPIQHSDESWAYELFIAHQAARWGADQELEACCKWLPKLPPWSADDLRRHRRPKPPSLKERALQAWAAVEAGTDDQTAMAVIRRALEQLDD